MTKPIRVGIIGLSPGQWAANAHLKYLQSPESRFKIVAVCNSSVESAKNAVKTLKLAEDTKTYGDPQDIANDNDVDLVVCAVRVDRHYGTIAPAIKAGKDVLVEWPLGKNLQEAEELLRLTKEHKTKLAAVGLQGRFDSTFRTVKKIIDEGRIGKVYSTSMQGPGMNGRPQESLNTEYLSQREVGGNLVTIPTGHFLDSFETVLGDISSYNSLLSVQRPTIDVVNPDGSVAKTVKQTSHDQILIHGKLASGAVFSFAIRGGFEFKNTPGIDWRIYGEKGEIIIKAPNLHMQIFGGTSIDLHDFETDQVEKIEFLKETFDDYDPINRNVARLYEAVAAGDDSAFCTFERAVEHHRFLDTLYKQNKGT